MHTATGMASHPGGDSGSSTHTLCVYALLYRNMGNPLSLKAETRCVSGAGWRWPLEGDQSCETIHSESLRAASTDGAGEAVAPIPVTGYRATHSHAYRTQQRTDPPPKPCTRLDNLHVCTRCVLEPSDATCVYQALQAARGNHVGILWCTALNLV